MQDAHLHLSLHSLVSGHRFRRVVDTLHRVFRCSGSDGHVGPMLVSGQRPGIGSTCIGIRASAGARIRRLAVVMYRLPSSRH